MRLSKRAEKLFDQLKMIDENILKERCDIWKRRMEKMTDEAAYAYFELFEELEAEGMICMSIEERPGKCPIPKRVIVKDIEDWF